MEENMFILLLQSHLYHVVMHGGKENFFYFILYIVIVIMAFTGLDLWGMFHSVQISTLYTQLLFSGHMGLFISLITLFLMNILS